MVALFRRDGASRKPELVQRFLRSKKAEWKWIARPINGGDVTSADVIILRKEYERREPAWGSFDGSAVDCDVKASSPAKRTPGSSAPPKHDWDVFAGSVAQRVHVHGTPVSLGELVREMLD